VEFVAADSPLPRHRAGWADLARRVENLGYSTLLLTDHYRTGFSPMVAQIAAAGATDRLRVCTLVLASDYRNPLVVAKEAATLDLLSDGRLELGLGAGWLAADYQMAGLPFERPADRIGRVEETARVLKRLLAARRRRSTASTWPWTRLPALRVGCSGRTRRCSSRAAAGRCSPSRPATPTSSA